MIFNLTKPKKNEKRNSSGIDFEDEKINVLLLGNSGCGKSTLINALLGKETAETGEGTAVTKNIGVYEDDHLPFRMIDSIGYEYGLFRQYRIKQDLSRFSLESVKNRDVRKLIHIIWYCIDGTAKRVDQEALNYISSVTKSWRGVPVIFVITKSYSEQEIEENTRMAKEAVATFNKKHKHNPINVKDVIPVVAKEYPINETTSVMPYGLERLILRTAELAPQAKETAMKAIHSIDTKLRNDKANRIIATASAASAAVGAIPVAVPDATILIPIQTRMVKELIRAYELEDEIDKDLTNQILTIGATTIAGRTIVKALKQVPLLNAAAGLIDAFVAGAVTFALGQSSSLIFTKIYDGEFDPSSMPVDEEVKRAFNDLMPKLTEQMKGYLEETRGVLSIDQIKQFFLGLIKR